MTTQFARRTGFDCTGCHVAPAKLNTFGEAFLARGYRLESAPETPRATDDTDTALIAAWVTGRHEKQIDKKYHDTFIPKVELISGGPVGDSFSYFVEWRTVSLSARPDGSLQDRGGRFEDAFVGWQFADGHDLRVGQFRSLNQYDVSRRLSLSEPAMLSSSLAGDPSSNKRLQSLGGFSPSGRSPGAAYTFQSLTGDSASDGLFHTLTLPLVGELTLPLSTEAQKEASFELEADLKGVFLESFYRSGVSSVGAHVFLDDTRWLAGGLGVFNLGDFYGAAGFGMDGGDDLPTRNRYSAELEYLPTWFDRIRGGLGVRWEHISKSGKEPALISYLILSGPNTNHTFELQAEWRKQEGNDAVILDASAIF